VSARPTIAVWSPLPPSSSGIADYVAEQLPVLARHADVRAVSREEDAFVADLDVYHVGNSPAHAFVYRAALRRPGVVVLHDWSLHQLVLCETVERGDVSSYLREMRRAHGETGSFVGRQVARALGGTLLPALFPLNERVLEGALAVVTLSRAMAGRVARALPGRRLLHLPHHLSLPLDPLPSRREARAALALAEGPIVTAPAWPRPPRACRRRWVRSPPARAPRGCAWWWPAAWSRACRSTPGRATPGWGTRWS
jgi:hypothetical protein